MRRRRLLSIFFFFNDTATTEIYTLSLHDALPIYGLRRALEVGCVPPQLHGGLRPHAEGRSPPRSEEHTSELQSRSDLVCRLLLEKKKKKIIDTYTTINLHYTYTENRFNTHYDLTT